MFNRMDGFKPKNCMSGYDFELWVQGILTTLKFDTKCTKGNDGYLVVITYNHMSSETKVYANHCSRTLNVYSDFSAGYPAEYSLFVTEHFFPEATVLPSLHSPA